MKLFILMTQLMTRIPIPMQVNVNEDDLGKGNIFFPFIGLIIGLFLAGVYQLACYFYDPSSLLVGVVTVVGYLWISGSLHMDGLSDTFDGLWSNRSRERMLEIMKDSRVGVFGVVILIMTLLIQTGTIQGLAQVEHNWQWLILIPALGRYGTVFSNAISAYARKEGMGKYFVQDCGLREWVLTTLYIFPIAYFLTGIWGVLAGGIVLAFTYLFVQWVHSKINGITGDIIGAVIELNQLIVLLYVVALA